MKERKGHRVTILQYKQHSKQGWVAMEGRQGHFQTGIMFLEVHVQGGQQTTPKLWTFHTVSR